mmetsp:Transcript_12811/g.36233  ORF Transcript_12811/g.36233 Transcript_12811/m.36233 type:complete len:127 (+) Transcript_12811:287-667(+)|eukprot:CAMPEP_0119129770 /NCGR_PEP_ID=MMETSP1310-20130426/7380_1 /TAXON_ID=464262 /ORGANISM="Genus nov. species nov., Strain RCC2339" /LENGTH=126 /DNA_ID=CAMNT_0007120213 /DNA_START=285 /DNA_END=665 /DNA_ORIENTATION=-
MSGLAEKWATVVFAGSTVGFMGGALLYAYLNRKEGAEAGVVDDDEPTWSLTRRFTQLQAVKLERLFQRGIRNPTPDQSAEILEEIGKKGTHGLLISRNMVALWFQERALRTTENHSCLDDPLKDCD